MNGAQALIRTLVGAGVDVCFANPGTSEMHFVAALDDVPEMRGVLTLFEGVATGAADGWARMTGRPGATPSNSVSTARICGTSSRAAIIAFCWGMGSCRPRFLRTASSSPTSAGSPATKAQR